MSKIIVRTMNKKLTLSLNEEVIEKAKIYAEYTGSSLSGLAEDYFEKLISPAPIPDSSDRLLAISGKIKLPKDFDSDQARRTAVKEKHLK
jgi:hypothetical protein